MRLSWLAVGLTFVMSTNALAGNPDEPSFTGQSKTAAMLEAAYFMEFINVGNERCDLRIDGFSFREVKRGLAAKNGWDLWEFFDLRDSLTKNVNMVWAEHPEGFCSTARREAAASGFL